MILQLIPPVLSLGASIIVIAMSEKFKNLHDRRTNKHRYCVFALVGLSVLFTAMTCAGICREAKEKAALLAARDNKLRTIANHGLQIVGEGNGYLQCFLEYCGRQDLADQFGNFSPTNSAVTMPPEKIKEQLFHTFLTANMLEDSCMSVMDVDLVKGWPEDYLFILYVQAQQSKIKAEETLDRYGNVEHKITSILDDLIGSSSSIIGSLGVLSRSPDDRIKFFGNGVGKRHAEMFSKYFADQYALKMECESVIHNKAQQP